MSIDLRNETLLTLTQAARMLPPSRRGRPIHLSCLSRWVHHGVKAPQGTVRLEAIRLGGRWLTSVEALERFAVAQTPDLTDRPQAPRTPRARQRSSERVEAELQKLGM